MKIYYLDKEKSIIDWEVHKNGDAISGRLKFAEGRIMSELGELLQGVIRIDLQTIDVLAEDLAEEEQQALREKIKSERFLAVDQYPSTEFSFDVVKDIRNDPETRSVLNLKGKAYSFPVPLALKSSDDGLQLESAFTVEEVNPTLFEDIIRYDKDSEDVHSIAVRAIIRANHR